MRCWRFSCWPFQAETTIAMVCSHKEMMQTWSIRSTRYFSTGPKEDQYISCLICIWTTRTADSWIPAESRRRNRSILSTEPCRRAIPSSVLVMWAVQPLRNRSRQKRRSCYWETMTEEGIIRICSMRSMRDRCSLRRRYCCPMSRCTACRGVWTSMDTIITVSRHIRRTASTWILRPMYADTLRSTWKNWSRTVYYPMCRGYIGWWLIRHQRKRKEIDEPCMSGTAAGGKEAGFSRL